MADFKITVQQTSAASELAAETATATPTRKTQTIKPKSGYNAISSLTLEAIPSEYIRVQGSAEITQNGLADVKNYESAVINVTDRGDQFYNYAQSGTIVSETLSMDNVKKVRIEALRGNQTYTQVNFQNCQTIESEAFRGTALQTVTLPKCKTIGERAFYGAESLTTVYINSVKKISKQAFRGCPLQRIYMNEITEVPVLINDGRYNPTIETVDLEAIYIPAALHDAFLADSAWAAYSSYLVAV